jgi:hypothetical protein
MHGQGKASVAGWTELLEHYAASLGLADQGSTVSEKGKEKIVEGIRDGTYQPEASKPMKPQQGGRSRWPPPEIIRVQQRCRRGNSWRMLDRQRRWHASKECA